LLRDDKNGKNAIFAKKIVDKGKYVFAQLTEFLPRRKFDGIVEKYRGNKYVKGLTCWNQMLIMVFGQLTARESTGDLVAEPGTPTIKILPFGIWQYSFPA
jgi:hypothetical protein